MDSDAFHNLAMAELDAVYRFAHHLARHRQEAEDLVQETYLQALRACSRFVPGEHGIRPWLFKILHNLVNTRLAKGGRNRDLLARYGAELEEAAPVTPEDVAVDGATAWDRVNWDGVDGRLKAAVLDLPIDQRAVFLLAAVEGLKYREIADLVEVPIGTVMSRLSRARRTLALRLTDLAAEHNLRGNGRTVPADGRNSSEADAREETTDAA